MKVEETSISGLFTIELDLIEDDRGSFREAWHSKKMSELGLPHFEPIQQNISQSKLGVIRGIHAEPWDKYVHVAFGSIFTAIVDLREQSESYGQYLTFTLDQSKALFLSKGLGNSFQTTSDLSVYSYLVNSHWQPNLSYQAIAFNDPTLEIPWPIKNYIVSEKDRNNPTFINE